MVFTPGKTPSDAYTNAVRHKSLSFDDNELSTLPKKYSIEFCSEIASFLKHRGPNEFIGPSSPASTIPKELSSIPASVNAERINGGFATSVLSQNAIIKLIFFSEVSPFVVEDGTVGNGIVK